MMKNLVTQLMSFLFLGALLTACGGGGGGTDGGGGGGNSISLTVVSGSGTTTTSYVDNGTDPVLLGAYSAPDTIVQMDSTSAAFLLMIAGNTVGSYPILQTGSNMIQYTVYSSGTTSTAIYSATSGTVTLTGFGNVGEPITGSFQAHLYQLGKPTDTMDISGSFSVTRDY